MNIAELGRLHEGTRQQSSSIACRGTKKKKKKDAQDLAIESKGAGENLERRRERV